MPVPKAKLAKFFKSFAPEYVLGTTYTVSFAFFESVVFPLLNRKKLKRCVVLCDKHGFQRATTEAFALRGATREYMAAAVPCRGSFHPKVWVMVGEQKFALMVGSGNLTQSGFINNLELFEVIEFDRDGEGKALVGQVASFLDGVLSLWPKSDRPLLVVEAIAEIKSVVQFFSETLSDGPDDVRLVTSFDGGLDGVLADEFRLHDDAISVGELHIAAPYFGGSSAGIERMQASLSPKQMTVYPAIHTAGGQGDCVDLPTVYMNESEEVRPRLAMARSLSHKSRFSHLKLFGAVVGNQHWLLNGSFNCTLAAIDGDNVEAAILRRVSAETFESYFSTETTNELTATEQLDNDYQRSPWWLFWAADLGDRIEIATDRQHNLPLTNVTIELRAGGHRARCQIDKLFDQNGSTKIPWSLFGETNGNASAARLIQINATDSVGNSVVGAALVDDVAALSADPSHRGAWRAAVALLSSEGMPQYADIAALFSLVQDVAFEEEEDDGKSKKRSVAGSTKTNQQAKTAIWPPEPMVTGTGALHGMGLAGGQLHWFDRILASLVRREHAADTNAATNDDDGDGEKIEDDAIEVAVDPRVVKGCERVWSHAFKQFCKLEQELTWMEIDLHQSARLWGPVTFMFLGTLAIQRSIVSAVGDHIETFPLTELLRDSAVMMFCDRDQGDDYSPTSACCYDDSMYPAVAYDLADRFDEYPHPEVCLPWLLAMAHLHAVEQKTKHHEFVLTAWLCFKDVAGDHLSLCLEDREHLKRMWLRYFGGGIEGLAWSDIEDAITRILKLTWHDHDGFAGVWSSKGLIDAGQFEIAEDTSGACLHDRCRLYGQVDPVNARKLKELQMAKCPACETVILPLRLHAVYQTEISLRSEDR